MAIPPAPDPTSAAGAPASRFGPPGRWPRDIRAGAVGAVVGVASVLSLGVVAMLPLGADAASAAGITASFTTVVVAAPLFAVVGRNLVPAGMPSLATTLLVSTLVGRVVAAAGDASHAEVVLQALVAVGAAVTLMGLLQIAMGLLSVGRLTRFVPQPVLGGVMNGIAALLVISQLPALLAIAPAQWRTLGWQSLPQASTAALAAGVATAAMVWTLASLAPKAPAALIGLLAGTAAWHALHAGWPMLALGSTIGPIEAALPWPFAWGAGGGAAVASALVAQAPAIALTGLLLALIGMLESAMALRNLDESFDSRHDTRRELIAIGLANVVGGVAGALPMVHGRARAAAYLQAGGRGGVPAIAAAGVSALLVTAGAGAIALLPRTVVAGVMLTIGVSLIDNWSRDLLKTWRRTPSNPTIRASVAIMALVTAVTVAFGTATGVAVGVVLSLIVFLRAMHRSLLRSSGDAASRPSRRLYPPDVERRLQPLRQRIAIFELDGAFFFGNAERLSDAAETLPASTRFLVVDLRRVRTIDESAAMTLRHLRKRLGASGVDLLLAGVGAATERRWQLLAHALGAAGDGWFVDTDHAVEHAERRLLAEAGPADSAVDPIGAAVPLTASTLTQGLDDAQRTAVDAHLKRRRLRAGERLFDEGDDGDCVYVVSSGSISVVGPTGQRYASYSPGTMFGELAMLDGRGRSAAAVADGDAEVVALGRDAFDLLAVSDPQLCVQLHRNIGLHLAERLRIASNAWREAAA